MGNRFGDNDSPGHGPSEILYDKTGNEFYVTVVCNSIIRPGHPGRFAILNAVNRRLGERCLRNPTKMGNPTVISHDLKPLICWLSDIRNQPNLHLNHFGEGG